MKPKLPFPLLILVAVAAGAGGWFASRLFPSAPDTSAGPGPETARKLLYYQSAMHPWIKSDRPGRCTICGMELTPVYEGEKGFAAGEGVITLGSNIMQVLHVQTDEVRRRPLRRTLRVAGIIEDDDTKHRLVSAYVEGRLDRLGVNHVGADVTAGQPLAMFYSPMLLAAEREYIALVKTAPGAASGPLAAEHPRLVEAAAQRLQRLGLSGAQIAALPAKPDTNIHTELRAPVSGTVVARFAYEGQYVKEGDKLFELADFSTMWFQFDAYERDLAWLRPGQKVEVTTPAVPGRIFPGAIAFLDPNLKEMTRSVRVRVELPNPLVEEGGRPRRELYHKLYAEAVVQIETPEVLCVPRTAVLMPGPQATAYVDKGNGAYEQRRLKLGRAGDDDWEILDGLAAGDRVVTSGNLLIDAQAQLDASVHEAPAPTEAPPPASSLPPLTDPQRAAVKQFLELANAITSALAGDDLSAFNAKAATARDTRTALPQAFEADSPWQPALQRVESAAHLASASDLASARKAFHPLSVAVVELSKSLRRQDAAFKALKIFRCPMTKDSFPGAPRTAEWLQLAPEIRNPYFGAEMLDCGSEVKP